MGKHSLMKLGKRARKHDPRALHLKTLLAGQTLPPPPESMDWTKGVADWGMMLNDKLGCCTVAAVGHAVQTWKLNCGDASCTALAIADSEIEQYYEKWDGYNPKDPDSDQGGVETDVLNCWRQQGFGDQPLDDFAPIHQVTENGATEINWQMLAIAIWLFGGSYIGIELPVRAQDQDVWDVPKHFGPDDTPGSWGGHAVYLVGYEQVPAGLQAMAENVPGSLTCITWGAPKKMTWRWFATYCSEAYALVSKSWIAACGLAPSGFNLEQLSSDLSGVR